MTRERAGKLGSAEGAALTSEAQGRLQRCYPTVASGLCKPDAISQEARSLLLRSALPSPLSR